MRTHLFNLSRITIIGSVLIAMLLPSLGQAQFRANPTVDPLKPFSYELQPGTIVKDSITVENTADSEQTFSLYGADATQSSIGTWALSNLGDEQRTIGQWIKFDTDTVAIPAGEKQQLHFTINVPTTVPPGVYSGGIAVATIPPQFKDRPTMGVQVSSRLALKLFITIPGEKNHSPSINKFEHYTDKNGNHKFKLYFKNDGNTTAIAESEIKIFGWPDGIDPGEDIDAITNDPEIKAELVRQQQESIIKFTDIDLMPGTEELVIEGNWDKKPLIGYYTAEAKVTLYEHDILLNENINPETKTIEISFTVIRWDLLLALIAIILLVVGFFSYKHYRLSSLRKISKNYKVQANDSLKSLADKSGISWKLLAKINKIKAPFSIEKNQSILLPPNKKA